MHHPATRTAGDAENRQRPLLHPRRKMIDNRGAGRAGQHSRIAQQYARSEVPVLITRPYAEYRRSEFMRSDSPTPQVPLS